MITRIWDWLRDHGYGVMVIGMAVTAAGAFLLFQAQRGGGFSRQAALVIGICGVVVYVIGRVAVMFKRRAKPAKDDLDDL